MKTKNIKLFLKSFMKEGSLTRFVFFLILIGQLTAYLIRIFGNKLDNDAEYKKRLIEYHKTFGFTAENYWLLYIFLTALFILYSILQVRSLNKKSPEERKIASYDYLILLLVPTYLICLIYLV